jgi:hypothetical protein
MRRWTIRGILVPGSLTAVGRFAEYAPSIKELCFVDVEKTSDRPACVPQEEGAFQGRNHPFG